MFLGWKETLSARRFLNYWHWFITNSCGENNDKSSPVITIFIGGVVCLPFPVMAGKNEFLLPTLQNYRFRSVPARIFGILNAFHILNLGSRIHPIPSAKRLQNYGKSQFCMGKSTINGHFQYLCLFTRGYIEVSSSSHFCLPRVYRAIRTNPSSEFFLGMIPDSIYPKFQGETVKPFCMLSKLRSRPCISRLPQPPIPTHPRFLGM